MSISNHPDDTSSSIFETVVNQTDFSGGGIDPSRIPAGMTLYGNLFARDSTTNGEIGTVRPQVMELDDGGVSTNSGLSELEVTLDEDGNIQSTGWQEITSVDLSADLILPLDIRAKVTDGTLSMGDVRDWGLVFEWRVD